MEEKKYYFVEIDSLPARYPTHAHDPKFWEELGRAIATFSFLEKTLGKAIFAFTVTKKYHSHEAEKAYQEWLQKTNRALTDPLVNLAEAYRKAMFEHPDCDLQTVDTLIDRIKEYAKIRNALCHGLWNPPDETGKSTLFFINKQKERFSTAIDTAYLQNLQHNTTLLACSVINSVTYMGWKFPGSSSPGEELWPTNSE